MAEEFVLKQDDFIERLDDLSDLCEYWKRNRKRGRPANAIRTALLAMCHEIALVDSMKRREDMLEIMRQPSSAQEQK